MLNNAEVFDTIVNTRRAVRKFHPEDYDPQAVTRSLQRAVLAPNSSNMQLWEFYRVSTPEKLKQVSFCCMSQNTTETAKEIIVVVARPDLWKRRAKQNHENVLKTKDARQNFTGLTREKYYSKLMPLLYNNDALGLRSLGKKIFVWFTGLKRPIVREVGGNDVRVVIHKSVALAAQTFMLSMTAEGHDTCPVEGFDSKRLKKLLNLPRRAEINMVITCGKRIPEGVYGERFRVPMEEIMFRVD
jgi:nitroreductase